MRRNNLLNIHSICVDIEDIMIKDNDFVINVHKLMNFDTLKKAQNYNDLVDTFSNLGYNYNVKLNYVPDNQDKKDNKVEILSHILGCKVDLK